MIKVDLSEAKPLKGAKFDYMALLQMPNDNVVQAFSLNNISDFYQYGIQLPNGTTQILKSESMSTYDWEYNHGDGRTINIKAFITLGNPLAGHTQTLVQNGGNIITGLYTLTFANLNSILKKAKDNGYDDLLDTFHKNDEDNVSWKLFKQCESHNITGTTSSDRTEHWCIDFVGLPNQHSDGNFVDGQYVNIVGTREILGDIKPYRTELVSSPNNQYCMLAVVDTSYTLHLYKFKLNLLDIVNMNHGGIVTELAAYWNESGFPTSSNVGKDHTKIGEALDFYKAVLNSDDLVIDLSQYPYDYIKYTQSQVLGITKISSKHFSYQGYGLDESGNIYIFSGFDPDSKHADSQPVLYQIPYDKDKKEYKTWLNLPCIDEFVKPVDNNPVIPAFIEPEGIQVLNDDNVLMAVSYHSTDPSRRTLFTRIYRAKW